MRTLTLLTAILLSSNVLAKTVDWKEHSPLCVDDVAKKVESFGVKSQWVRMIASKPGSFAYRAPIEIGVWAQIIVQKDDVTVSKMTEANAVVYHYSGETCNPQIAVKSAPKDSIPGENDLGDADLKKLVASGEKGVIYIWSPHMTLSPKGYHNIKAAAEKLGVKVYSYVDPAATEEAVRKVVSKGRIPASAKTKMHSFDLVMRGATLHYPATFTFKDGKLSRWAKHGYEDSVQFEEFLKQEFNK